MRQEIESLTAAYQQELIEWQRDHENAEKDRLLAEKDWEMLLLRVETRLLRHERNLPPPDEND